MGAGIKKVIAGGGVLFEKRDENVYVLLIFRRGVWDLPKGKKEERESVAECARREVAEEVGCPLPKIKGKLATTCHEYDEGGKRVEKSTSWFAMQTTISEGFQPEQQEGISKVQWFLLNKAKQKVGYLNLQTVLAKFEHWLSREGVA